MISLTLCVKFDDQQMPAMGLAYKASNARPILKLSPHHEPDSPEPLSFPFHSKFLSKYNVNDADKQFSLKDNIFIIRIETIEKRTSSEPILCFIFIFNMFCFIYSTFLR